jgi:hypothetical protein
MTHLSILLSIFTAFASVAEEKYISYEELTLGMKPSEAYVAGANKLIEYASFNEDYACKFMVSLTYDAHLNKMREVAKEHYKTQKSNGQITEAEVAKLLSISDEEMMFNTCKEMNLANESINTRASLDNISKELVQETKAFFRAKYPDGKVRTVLMKKEKSVWKVAAIK